MTFHLDAPWLSLGAVAPAALRDARLVSHWAAQIVAPVGSQLIAAQPDYSHTALGWRPSAAAVATLLVDGSGRPSYRAGLRLSDLHVVLLDAQDDVVDSFALVGRTLNEGLVWLSQAIARYTGAPLPAPLTLVGYTMQTHPVRDGAPFPTVDPGHLAELERWFRNGFAMMSALQSTFPGAQEVRMWPHHFDVATLMAIDTNPADPESARSIGFGLSPGDDTYAEPYWYVLPWPPPDPAKLAALDVGTWHTEGFVAAVLTGGRDAQTVEAFFRSAERESRAVL